MRLEQYINGGIELNEDELSKELEEVFNTDNLQKVKIDKLHFIDEYKFMVDNKEYRIRIMKFAESGIYDILFFLKDKNNEITSLTNFGKANEIIGNVINAISKFVDEYKPKIFQFEANGSKRIRIYDIITKKYLPKNIKKYKLTTEWKEDLPIKIYRFSK